MELANDGVGRGLVKASRGATTGNWPECAAGYLAAVKASHKRPSHTLRSYACSGYGCVLTQQERAKGTPETHEVLKKIANGKFNDAVHVRATAAYHLGLVRWDANERDGAARMYHKAIALCKGASPAERAVVVCTGEVDSPAGNKLDMAHARSAENLKLMGHSAAGLADAPDADRLQRQYDLKAQRVVETLPPAMGAQYKAANAYQQGADAVRTFVYPQEYASFVERCRRVRGGSCDQCGVLASDAKLSKCRQCMKRHYCGHACQSAAWKGGHKAACRKTGVFKPGDRAIIRGLEKAAKFNGAVGVVSEATGPGGRVVVDVKHVDPGLCQTVRMKPENLDYLLDDDAA